MWTDQREEQLLEAVGDERPVTQATAAAAATTAATAAQATQSQLRCL